MIIILLSIYNLIKSMSGYLGHFINNMWPTLGLYIGPCRSTTPPPKKKPHTFVFWVLCCEHWTCSSDLFCSCSRRQWCIPGRQYRESKRVVKYVTWMLNPSWFFRNTPCIQVSRHLFQDIDFYAVVTSGFCTLVLRLFCSDTQMHIPETAPILVPSALVLETSLGLGLRPAQSSFISTPEWTGVCRLCAFIWF